jgi:rhodanese-related sulfurtransferase
MKSAWSKGILPLILCFAAGLLFSSFSPAVHADSGSLYISTESVLSMLKKRQEILFVDVRDRGAFDRFRIPGSIHIPLYALKTKPFLKDKPLVLVSEGYPNFALEQTCEGVRVAGFSKTSILHGGLRCWMQKKGAIEGDAFAAHDVSRLPPKDFFSQKDSPEWVVIALSGSEPGSSPPMIPGAIALPWEGDPRKFASSLKAILNTKARSPLLSVLICNEKGEKYESIERAVQQEEIRKVFYLKGGMEAYRAFLEQQALLGQPGREEVKRCVNCQ